MLGAVTDDGNSFYCWTEESLTADHGIQLLEALVEEFGEDLVAFLDRARHFYAKDLWEYMSGKRGWRPKILSSDSRLIFIDIDTVVI